MVVSAFLVPGSPLPYLRPDNPPWRDLASGYRAAGAALRNSKPDAVITYSTQWIAVLDQLWQTRPHLTGVHVDENWYEYGDLPFDITVDAKLAQECVEGSPEAGVRARAVDYDAFPIDTGTIVMAGMMFDGDTTPLVIGANNLYHDGTTTEKLAAMAVAKADAQQKRVAIVGIGGLSGSIFRHEIDIANDKIYSDVDDRHNRNVLALLERADVDALSAAVPGYAKDAKADMGLKHLSWVLGGLGGRYARATVHAYGPVYGSGAAVVEFVPA